MILVVCIVSSSLNDFRLGLATNSYIGANQVNFVVAKKNYDVDISLKQKYDRNIPPPSSISVILLN